MSNQEYKFLMTDVLHSPHQSLADCKTYDRLAHLYATDYAAYKDAAINMSGGNALVHTR